MIVILFIVLLIIILLYVYFRSKNHFQVNPNNIVKGNELNLPYEKLCISHVLVSLCTI